MRSKRQAEGYLIIENPMRAPLPTIEEIMSVSQPGRPVTVPDRVRTYESATVTCEHCHAIVVLNPDRSRPREWCFTCDSYICDVCALRRKQGVTCMPLRVRNDIAVTKELRRLARLKE